MSAPSQGLKGFVETSNREGAVADVTFECSISCTDRAEISLNNTPVPLDESQLVKTGKLTVKNVGATVHIKAQIEGVKGTAWSLDITPVCPNSQPPKLWHRSGTLEKGGLILSGDAAVPANPCGSTDGMELSKVILPVKRVTTPEGGKAAKKAAAKSPKNSSAKG